MTPSIDYAALAKQAGATSSTPPPQAGKVDYAALAKQAGAISSVPPAAASIGAANRSSLGTMFDNARSNLATLPDFAKGMAEGGYNTVGGLLHMVGATKAGDAFTNAAIPQNQAQAIGRGTEQVGEFLVPGMDGEALASKAVPLAARAGRFAAGGLPGLTKLAPLATSLALPAAKIGSAALTTGALNMAQGGSGLLGAAAGAAGAGLGALTRAAAPVIAQKALGVRALDRSYGANPGAAIMRETTGIRPATIASQAQTRLTGLDSNLDAMTGASPLKLSMQPSRDVAEGGSLIANAQNNRETIGKMRGLNDQVNLYHGSVAGNPAASAIPSLVTPSQLLQLKRGIGDTQNIFSSQAQSDIASGTAAKIYKTMDGQLDNAIPGFQQANQQIQSLIPVAKRAGNTDLNDGILARSIGRAQAHTGAAALGLGGAAYGNKEGGLPGLVAGGVGGFIAPELATNPTMLMTLARGLASPTIRKTASSIAPLTLQLDRK